jgi:hypothetical protein
MGIDLFGISKLSDEEQLDIALVYGGAVLLGIGSIVLRIQSGRPTGGIDQSVFSFQYAIAYIFLGAILLLRTRARTAGGVFLTTGIAGATLVGLLLPAPGVELIDIVSYGLLTVLVFMGGILYYRMKRPTNAQAIGLVALLMIQFWLYSVTYVVLAFLQVGNPLLLVGLLVLTAIAYGMVRILIREYENSYSTALDPLINRLSNSN